MSQPTKTTAPRNPAFEGPAPPADNGSAAKHPLGALLAMYQSLPEELRGGAEADGQLGNFFTQFKKAHAEQMGGKK